MRDAVTQPNIGFFFIVSKKYLHEIIRKLQMRTGFHLNQICSFNVVACLKYISWNITIYLGSWNIKEHERKKACRGEWVGVELGGFGWVRRVRLTWQTHPGGPKSVPHVD